MAVRWREMNGRKLIIIGIIVSVTFNLLFALGEHSIESADSYWLFPDLGPAIIQDSAFGRAPALESPIGIIGDLPGFYSMYDGSPLQYVNDTGVARISELEPLLLALVFCATPFIILLILGRRSYGSSKTQ